MRLPARAGLAGAAGMIRLFRVMGIAAAFAVGAPHAYAAEGAGQQQTVKREIIPGSELMTGQERERYRLRLRGAKSDEERQRLRAEHVKAMQERARVRGLELRDPSAGRGAKP